jgi:hypothetical protein
MEGVKLSPDKFAASLEKLVTDSRFRATLKTEPLETLKEMGVEITDKKRALKVAQRLSSGGEMVASLNGAIPLTNGAPQPSTGVEILSYVDVGVDVVVDTTVLLAAEVEQTEKAIQALNVAKMRKALTKKARKPSRRRVSKSK